MPHEICAACSQQVKASCIAGVSLHLSREHFRLKGPCKVPEGLYTIAGVSGNCMGRLETLRGSVLDQGSSREGDVGVPRWGYSA